MSCRVPRHGVLRRFPVLCRILIMFVVLLSHGRSALALTAALGDFDHVTVMEVSGSFDAVDGYGQANLEPRRAIAREFYRVHGDDYDFLVIFTNFEFLRPPGVRAFFSPAKNDIRGIGLELYDNTPAYSAAGGRLDRLQGTIDMGDAGGYSLEPADPEFEKTLQILTHEFMHRWGAYVRFRDGSVDSEALLGYGGSHWSFLLDAGGSTLYGNHWQDNGDGTFTTITPEQSRSGDVLGRVFNPLELYLMGLVDKAQVPPMLLVDAPGFDPAQLPQSGITVPGTAKTVTIDNIIAAEGARIPSAGDARREFRLAFIYAVSPGSWSADHPADRSETAALGRLRAEWGKRFSILTGGSAIMQTELVPAEAAEFNPPVPATDLAPASAPAVDASVDWLIGRQGADGSWEDQPGSGSRDTAAAVAALTTFPAAAGAVAGGRTWLAALSPGNNDFLARKLTSVVEVDTAALVARQNADGGWGLAPGYASNPIDTALAVRALAAHGRAESDALASAVTYFHAWQNPDGGWSSGSGRSMVVPTASVVLALNDLRGSHPLEPVIADGLAWLTGRSNPDNGFGSGTSTIAETSLALRALKAAGSDASPAEGAIDYLLARQSSSGSWNDSTFLTAQAVEALYAGQIAADLAVESGDIGFSPNPVDTLPAAVTATVTIRNLGRNPALQVRVELFEGAPAVGRLAGEAIVDVPGNGRVQAVFPLTIHNAGILDYHVVVDGDNHLVEANEWNNRASRTLAAGVPAPTIGFAVAAASGTEAMPNVSLAVNLSHPWPVPVTVSYSANVAGTAIPPTDYLPADGTLTFAADETTGLIKLTVINDQVAENDKTIVIDLSEPSTGTLGLSRCTYTILDDEPPVVTITSPPAGGIINSGTPQLVYVTTADSVVVKVDGVVSVMASGGNLGPLTDGPHSVEVAAANATGQVTTARSDFTVDSALPVIVINTPLTGVVTDARPLLDYTVTSAARVEVLVDGAIVNVAAGSRLGPLADGEHTVTVKAWNAGGAGSSARAVFHVDARPPRVDIIYPGNEFVREVAPTLRFQADEAGQALVWLDGVTSNLRSGDHLGPLSGGIHRLRVVVTDAVGNAGADEVEFFVVVGEEAPLVTGDNWPMGIEGTYGGMAVDRSGNLCTVTRRTAREFDIAMFDPAGHPLWRVVRSSYFITAGGNWVDIEPKDVAIDSAGNIYVVGWGFSSSRYYSVLAKYDVDGTYMGHVLFDTRLLYSDVKVYSIHVDSSDQVHIAGNTENDLFAADYTQSASMFVATFDRNLTRIYGRCYGSPSDPASFYFASRNALTVDGNGNLYIAGRTGGNRLLVWRLAPDLARGGVEIVGSDSTLAADIGVDPSGNVVVAGSSPAGGAVWTFAAADGRLLASKPGVTPVGLTSLAINPDGTLLVLDGAGMLSKLDVNLDGLWTITLGSDLDATLILASSGRVYVGGSEAVLGRTMAAGLSDPRLPWFSFSRPVYYAANPSVMLSGTLEPGYEVSEAGGQYPVDGYLHDDSGHWQMLLAGLPEGESRLTLAVAGVNGFVKNYETRVVVDTVPPAVTITAPADRSAWSSKPCLAYAISEGEVRVFLNGVEMTRQSGARLDSLRPGENRIRVQSTDAAGNVGADEITIQASGTAVGEYPLIVDGTMPVGAAGDQTVVDAGEDAAGNLYVFGDTIRNAADPLSRDLYVARFDPAGKPVDRRTLGPVNAGVHGAAMEVTAGGELLVAYNVIPVTNDPKSRYVVIARYSAAGTLLWSSNLSSGMGDTIWDITVDSSGNVYACGDTAGRLDNKRYGGNGDYFIVKYSSQGGKLWTVLSNAPTFDSLRRIEVAADGFLYGGGWRDGDKFMTFYRFDQNGGLSSRKDYSYPGELLGAERMRIDRNGNAYTLVEMKSSLYEYYYYVAKHTAAGDFVAGVYGRAPSIKALGLSLDAASNVYVTGRSDDPYGKGWSFDGNRSFGDEDIFVAKYAAADLQTIWTRQMGGSSGEQGSQIIFSRLGARAYLAGTADGHYAAGESPGVDIFLSPLMQMAEPSRPALTVTAYRSPSRDRFQVISGNATPGSVVSAVVAGVPASLPALSPVAQFPDGSWSFTVGGLAENADTGLTVSASDATGTASQTLTITVDTLPPLMTIGPFASSTEVPVLTVSGEVESGAVLTAAGVPGDIPVVNGRWHHTFENLHPGENSFTLIATDGVGNRTVRPVIITYLPPPPPTMAVTPAVIAEDEPAEVALEIGNLSPPGATVSVVQTLDLDGNGRIDAGEPVVRRFNMTDGLRDSNPDIVSDADGSINGQIIAHLNLRFVKDRYHAAGNYLYTVQAATGSASHPFTVIAVTVSQGVAGRVRNVEGLPVGGAMIELRDPWGRSHGFAVADSEGVYRLNVRRPGDYLPMPTAAGYVYDKETATRVTVGSGQTAYRDLVLSVGSRRVGGRISDAVTAAGLAGLSVRAENSRYLAVAMTEGDGRFMMRVPPGDYGMSAETRPGDGLAAGGYIGSVGPLLGLKVVEDLVGVEVAVEKGERPVCGRVVDPVGNGIGGVPVLTVAADGSGRVASAYSAGQGGFCTALPADGGWQLWPDDQTAYGAGLIGTAGTQSAPELTIYPIDAWIEGIVRDGSGQPVSGLTVAVEHAAGIGSAVATAPDGRYLLGVSTVAPGEWLLAVDADEAGFAPVPPWPFSPYPDRTATRDITLSPARVNSITITKASYDTRRRLLNVEASSNYTDAQLQVVDFGPMTFARQAKGKYIWTFSRTTPAKPATVTVSGPEGSRTVAVQ